MRIGFIGMGKMADAVLAGVLQAGVVSSWDVMACEKLPERRKAIGKQRKIIMTDSPVETVRNSQVVILAVKPQDLDGVLTEIAPVLTSKHLIISIAAGKKLAGLEKLLGKKVRLARVMPNLPLTAGAGMSVFCLNKAAKPADRKTVSQVFACAGEVAELPERMFDAVTALSGSGPAFFAYVLQAMTKAAVKAGLDKKAAPRLAMQTMLGTAKVLLEGDGDVGAFIKAVCSPKGTTIAGVEVLEASDIGDVLAKTIAAASNRSRELGR